MNFVIVVPEPIQSEIEGWALNIDAEDELYRILSDDFTQQELDKLPRVPGPGFTYIYGFDFQDPLFFGITHSFTFWLVHTAQDGQLAIYHCEHRQAEDWGLTDYPDPHADDEDERDYGQPEEYPDDY